MQRGAWMVMLAGVLLACPVVAKDAPLPSVDLGVHELDAWKLSLISRRTDADWWVFAFLVSDFESTEEEASRRSLPFRVFRSADVGRSWREDAAAASAIAKAIDPLRAPFSISIDFLVWYTPEVGLMAGDIGADVLRTTDGGRTWSRVRLPLMGDFRVLDLERVRGRTWICSQPGSIFRSDDSGATWIRLTGAAFKTQDGCIDISFQDSENGRVVGTHDTSWTTQEGGTTWRRIDATAQTPLTYEYEAPAAVMGDDTVVKIKGGFLQTYVAGQLVRTSPLKTAGSGVLTPLDGLCPRQLDTLVGWKEDQVVLSYDEGDSWFVVGRVPEKPLRTLAPVKNGKLFAQTQAKNLFVSTDQGRTWKPSTDGMDAYDFAVATGVAPEKLKSPLQCLLTASEARVNVQFRRTTGCLVGEKSRLELNLSRRGMLLSGTSESGETPLEVPPRTLPRDEGLRILRTLVNAATRQEALPVSCDAPARYEATIEWSCVPKESGLRKVEFESVGCAPLAPAAHRDGVPPADAVDSAGYARSLGVYQAAAHALEGASQ